VNSSSPHNIKTKIVRLKENKGDLNMGKFEDSLEWDNHNVTPTHIEPEQYNP